jgi:hypothetical protein
MYKMEEKKNPPNSLGLFPSLRPRQKAYAYVNGSAKQRIFNYLC